MLLPGALFTENGRFHSICIRWMLAGVGVTDREALQAMGIRTKEVSDLMARAFNEMIFIHGYVHCECALVRLFCQS